MLERSYGPGPNRYQMSDQAFQKSMMDRKLPIDLSLLRAQGGIQTGLANINAGAQRYGYDVQGRTSMYNADRGLDAARLSNDTNRYVTDVGAKTSRYNADRQAGTSISIAGQNAEAQKYGSDRDLEGRRYTADANAGASNYASDRGLEGIRVRDSGESSRQQSMLDWKGGQISGLLGAFSSGGGASGGMGPQPTISARPVYTPGEIRGQQNAMFADAQSAAQNQMSDQTSRLAGQGFSSRSPLLAALQTNAFGQGMSNAQNSAREFGLQASQANAGQVLNAQQAREQQYSNRNQEAIGRDRNRVSFQSSLLNAIAQAIS